MLRPPICVCVVSVSTCPGTEAWDRWPLTHSGDSKSEASASFVKTTAVSCTTSCTLASLRAYRRVGGGRSPKTPLKSSPNLPRKGQRRASSLNCSQLSTCRKHLATRSQVMDTGSKPMGSEQGAFPTWPKELEMVTTKHLARTAPGCRNSGVFFQSRHGMTDVGVTRFRERPLALDTSPHETGELLPRAVDAAILFSSLALISAMLFLHFWQILKGQSSQHWKFLSAWTPASQPSIKGLLNTHTHKKRPCSCLFKRNFGGSVCQRKQHIS